MQAKEWGASKASAEETLVEYPSQYGEERSDELKVLILKRDLRRYAAVSSL